MNFHLATEKCPPRPGLYNVVFVGVRSFLPIFKVWDGENWLGVPCVYGTIANMSWSELKNERTN